MTDPRLEGVSVRLEKIISESCPHHPPSQELFDLYEQIAIQILDSEFMDFQDHILEEYLMNFLQNKRKELGL